MRTFKWITAICIMIMTFHSGTLAQNAIKRNPKLFDTWISTDRLLPLQKRGELYEIKDSSILVSDSEYKRDYVSGNFRTAEIDVSKIELIKIRRNNSVQRGALIGAAAGLGMTLFGILSMEDGGGSDSDGLQTVAFIFMGSGMTLFGGGIGALVGSIKMSIPIERSYEHFNMNKSKLQNYAYVQKNSFGVHEHESYIGLLVGPSVPLGSFTDKSKVSTYAKSGYSSNVINLGYMIKPSFGISIAAFDNQYDAGSDNGEDCWIWAGMAAGPLFTFPAGKRFFLDLKPRIGFADMTFYIDENDQTSVSGFLINPVASLRYNFSKRWGFISETGYMYSGMRTYLAGENKFQALNLSFGINYRFR